MLMLSSRFESSSKTLRRDSSFCMISDGCEGFRSKLILSEDALLPAAEAAEADPGVPAVAEEGVDGVDAPDAVAAAPPVATAAATGVATGVAAATGVAEPPGVDPADAEPTEEEASAAAAVLTVGVIRADPLHFS